MQKILLILGMHRSGTSLVTQWLFRCGLDVGTHLLPAGIGNKEGHFEDEEFLSLHKQWLTKRKLSDTGLIAHDPSPLQDEEVQQLETLVSQKRNNEQWGWKEPRTCLWLPVYKQMLPDAYSLIVVRNFNDTVNSSIMREYRTEEAAHQRKVQSKKGLSKLKWKYLKRKRPKNFFKRYAEEYLKVWVHYYEKIVAYCNDLPAEKYLLVSYEDLLSNDKEVLDKLIHQWGFSLQPVPFKDVFKRELLSTTQPISLYVHNKALLDRAIQLEAHCRKLSQGQQVRKNKVQIKKK